MEREMETLKGQIRVSHRSTETLKGQLETLEDEKNAISKENKVLREKLKNKSDEYRNKLLEYLTRVSHLTDESKVATGVRIEDPEKTASKLYNELVRTHEIREDELESDGETLRKRHRKLNNQFVSLFHKYQSLIAYVKDMFPPGDVKSIPSHLMDESTLSNEVQIMKTLSNFPIFNLFYTPNANTHVREEKTRKWTNPLRKG